MHPLVKEVQKSRLKKVPEIKTGYTVRVHQKITEGNKERVQVFEGLVIKTGHGEGIEKTITVRKIVQGIGVEKIFPVHSPNITKIEVKKKAKVRRSKLYYMRQRSGKSARLQERHVTEKERAEEEARMEALIQEAVEAEEKRKAEEAKAKAEAEAEAEEGTVEPSGDAVGTADMPSTGDEEGAEPTDQLAETEEKHAPPVEPAPSEAEGGETEGSEAEKKSEKPEESKDEPAEEKAVQGSEEPSGSQREETKTEEESKEKPAE